jgi:hypothetical protein
MNETEFQQPHPEGYRGRTVTALNTTTTTNEAEAVPMDVDDNSNSNSNSDSDNHSIVSEQRINESTKYNPIVCLPRERKEDSILDGFLSNSGRTIIAIAPSQNI